MTDVGFDVVPSVGQILAELGQEGNRPLLAVGLSLWASYADKDSVYPRLRYHYVKRQCADALIGGTVAAVSFTQSGVTDNQGDIFKHFAQIRDDCHEEIMRLEGYARASRPPVTGTLTTVQPNSPCPGRADPNSGYYRGLPGYGPLGPYKGW